MPTPDQIEAVLLAQSGQFATDRLENLRFAQTGNQQTDGANSLGTSQADIRARAGATLDETQLLQIPHRPSHGGPRDIEPAHQLPIGRQPLPGAVLAREDRLVDMLENTPMSWLSYRFVGHWLPFLILSHFLGNREKNTSPR